MNHPPPARRYEPGAPDTPKALRRCFESEWVRAVTVRGDVRILEGTLTGFFCSVRCPGEIILRVYDLARELRNTERTLIGGFQSPIEKEFLDLLLRGSARAVVCPARGIENMRIPPAWRPPICEGRLLILSPFNRTHPRPTAALAAQRNALLAALAAGFLIPYAAPAGKTEALARTAAAAGKPLTTLATPATTNLLTLGARPHPAPS